MQSIATSLKDINQLLHYTILGIPLYKFILALAVFLFSLLLRKFFVIVVVKFIKRLAKKTATEVDDIFISITSKPIGFLIVISGLLISFLILGMKHTIITKLLKSIIIVVISWTLYNLVNTFSSHIYGFTEKFGKEMSKELGSFLIKLFKVFAIGIGVLAILQEWGINISAIIASLGLGGLAFALAAKDTAANLFGGLTVLIDKTMKVGDWVKIGDVEGIVEDIGLRTSKIRSFENSLIVIPNQILANQSLENFSRRNVRRIKMTIGVTYSTKREQMVKMLEEIRTMLETHPNIAKDQLLMVYFTEFGDSSLNILIYCFANTIDWKKYMAIREDVNLKIMEIVEKHGASFAFPSTSIYVEKLPEPWNKKET